ncbi:MAG: S1C family serine protease [Anaerovoracaceae bacterium]
MDDWDKFQYDDNKTVYADTAEAPKRAPKEKKEPVYVTRKAFAVTLIICMVISAAVGAGAYALAMSHFGGAVIDKTVTTTNYNLASATGSELSVQEIIARNENSVVAISTESVSTDTWLRQYITQGAGSGVIYSEDGYIITNNHVIEDASTIKVTLYDGSSYDATLVASDEQTDLAVIKIGKTGLTPVTIGTMDSLSVGDLVVAIGNPLGTLSGTATEGIISALEREITLDGKTMTLIQTSASINPGNSGGGLFDQHGNLIGIVVAKSSGSDVEGLGFAIPCDKVSNVVKSLIENGYVEGRPAAGITIVDLTSAQKAMQYGVSITGVYIQEVTGENAKKAGLKAGDLIYYLDDVKITDSATLLKTIQSHQVGDTVEFTVVRDNEMKKIKVQLQDAQEAAGSSN